MNLDSFITKYTGQFIDFDHAYGAQCVDLINQYCVEVLGIQSPIAELPGDTAANIYKNYSGQLFEKIDNTPTGVPTKGDIMFWDTSIGSAGHTAIFVSGDENSFISFDQNFPTGSPCHTQSHSYGGVMGWIRLKNAPNTNVSVDSATFNRLVHNSTVSDQVNDYLQTPHNSDFAPTIKEKLDELKNRPITIGPLPAPSIESSNTLGQVPTPPPNNSSININPFATFFTWLFKKI